MPSHFEKISSTKEQRFALLVIGLLTSWGLNMMLWRPVWCHDVLCDVTEGIYHVPTASIKHWLPSSCYGPYLKNRLVDFAHFLHANQYGQVYCIAKDSWPSTRYVSLGAALFVCYDTCLFTMETDVSSRILCPPPTSLPSFVPVDP